MGIIAKFCTGKMVYVNVAAGLSLLLLVIGLSVGLNVSTFKGSDTLDSVPLIDGHNDLPFNLYSKLNNKLAGFDLKKDLSNDSIWGKVACKSCFTDLPRLRKGKVGAQFWAAYVRCDSQYKDAVQLTLRQIDVIKRLVARYPNDLEFVTEADNIETAWRNGKIASMIGVEGGHSIDSSLAVLRLYYELGVRYLTLTHSCNTPWADASPINENSVHNLTDFGVVVVHEMNRLGMLVDLAHVSHNVMRKVLAVTKAPIIFSHSSAFSICNNYRNVPDDVLHSVKENNGIVMVNFYSHFVNCNSSRNATIQDVIGMIHNQDSLTIEDKLTDFDIHMLLQKDNAIVRLLHTFVTHVSPISLFIDHINYIRNLIGPDHVGIGADYDGISQVPEGLEDVSKYPDLFDRLYESNVEPGWTREDLEKLAGRNLIRVFKAVEAVRDSLATELPREDVISGLDLYNAEVSAGMKPGSCQTAKEWDGLNATSNN